MRTINILKNFTEMNLKHFHTYDQKIYFSQKLKQYICHLSLILGVAVIWGCFYHLGTIFFSFFSYEGTFQIIFQKWISCKSVTTFELEIVTSVTTYHFFFNYNRKLIYDVNIFFTYVSKIVKFFFNCMTSKF